MHQIKFCPNATTFANQSVIDIHILMVYFLQCTYQIDSVTKF